VSTAPHEDPDQPTEDGEHPLYAFLMAAAGQDPSDLAIVQTALFHRPVQDFLGIWVCERCGFCRSSPADPEAAQEVHHPVSAYAPCEQLRLLAWPYRNLAPGYELRWLPEEVLPTNPPTLVGGTDG
jgi:hypothetical protein